MGYSLLGYLLMVDSVLGHIDGVRLRQRLHLRNSALLAHVKRDFGDMLDFCLHQLLVVGGRRVERCVYALNTHRNIQG